MFRLLVLVAVAICGLRAYGQQPLSLSTTAVEPARFVAAHGRRALAMGYAQGLEIWAYPLQLVRDYRVSFVLPGANGPLDGPSLLRKVEYRPEEIIRTYIGPDFLVREHIFVPLDEPAAILTYKVEGRAAPCIRVSFLPVMNLMWPGALGGQDVRWSDPLSGSLLAEQSEHFRALVASPDVQAHSDVGNPTLRTDLTQSLALRPYAGQARLYISLVPDSDSDGRATLGGLVTRTGSLEQAARDHYAALFQHTLRMETPDPEVNRALAWSEAALDQAWVTNPKLGSGIVAGYGPSRGERRPQYAWFFAGDGLIATDALVATGEYERARAELAFILKYQNAANGMIWHELSQSAGFLDWAGKYPYMYVHVDITFAFLSTFSRYVETTGDTAFLAANWPRIAAAYRYCRSVLDPATGLPAIPPGKEGGDEQTRMKDDLGLSASWLGAAQAYAMLAEAAGHSDEARQATLDHDRAARSIAARYWDPATGFWLAGHTVAGAPITALRSRPAGLLARDVFTPAQQDSLLNKLASANFQTDWGSRSLSAASPGFDPDSYSRGSVSALGTANLASAFWRVHRPAVALQMWSALLPWFHLDSLGHLHEVLAGDFFHPQVESVPEQTWSSAAFLESAVHGLLGIAVHGSALTLAPHLPAGWDHVSVEHIHVAGAQLSVRIERHPGEIDLTLNDDGAPVELTFAPQLPLGAAKPRAALNGRSIPVRLDPSDEDPHATVQFRAASGETRCRIRYTGGVEVLIPTRDVQPGDPSTEARLTNVGFAQGTLRLAAQIADPLKASVTIRTPWKPAAVEGGELLPLGPDLYRMHFSLPAGFKSGTYSAAFVAVRLR